MLSKPFLAKCSERTSMPKHHPTSFSPEEWFSNAILGANNLFGISFDFFVNWSASPNSITPVVWIKRILQPQFSYSDLTANLDDALVNEFGIEYLSRLISLTTKLNLQVQFIIFRDDLDWSNASSTILTTSITQTASDKFSFTPSVIPIGELKDIIKANSGGAVQIGSKGLIYGTSRLECFLSSTDSLYPGDVDLILVDATNNPKAILEFKKHTLTNPISNQRLSNYYPNPDGRKYNRLAILRDYIGNRGFQIPLVNVYYPTNATFTEGKVEIFGGSVGNLSTLSAGNFTLPINNSTTEFGQVVTMLKSTLHI